MSRGPRGEPPRSAGGAAVVLRAGREKPVVQRHPWVFSGAVHTIGESAKDGDVVEVRGSSGGLLARGVLNRRSQIVARLLTWDPAETIDAAFYRRRVERAVTARPPTGAARLINAEADGLPGLIADRYGDFVVIQASTLGADRAKPDVVRAFVEVLSPRGVYERSDVDGRQKEGLEPLTGVLAGEEPPAVVELDERTHDGGAVRLFADLRSGHKTGAYLDQADNRRAVGSVCDGAEVLNLFSYTGGFGLHAARGGARRVVNVDSSADALSLSARAAEANGFADRIEHVRADAFETLRALREEGRSFDVVVVDPPKFAHSAGHVERAARAYKDLSRLAFRLTRPGGFVAAFSCSGLVSTDLFQKIVWSAALEAERDAQIVRRLCQPADHPVLLSFPEGEYLKGLLCRAP